MAPPGKEIETMAVSKAQIKATAKYEAKAYDKTLIRLPKGRLDEVRAHIEPAGESLNGFIGRAIVNQMERDSAGGPQEAAGAAAGDWGIPVSPDTQEAAQQAAEGGGSGLLSADLLEVAQEAAQMTGETLGGFVSRSIKEQCRRDGVSIRMGINPATGDKLKREA